MSEDQAEYVTDALEMMGAGYDQPTVIIEPPRTITARRNGRMVEVEEPAWVKFSTDFKKELRTLDEYSLKVFIYIGLSVSFRTGIAYPGVRKIAEDTGMDKGTVAKATANLEALGFLTIQKREGNSNIYKPVRYISIGTVRPERTLPSDEDAGLSDETGELSDDSRVEMHNKKNKKEQENSVLTSKDKDLVDMVIEYQIKPMSIRTAIHDYFRLNTNWETKTAREWMEWAIGENVTAEQIKFAADLWRTDKRFNWQPPTLKAIFEKWQMLMVKAPEVPLYKSLVEDTNVYVPNPNPRRR